MTTFDRLHPALQHHIVNSLGWRGLRPLQEAAIEPLLGGENALLLAPTAAGKTEAAFFPLLSRMMSEDWRGLSVLYVCPLRALLNNLAVRLEQYCGFVGRRVGLWHGDVGASERNRIAADPPECLLITPESIEVILVSRHRDNNRIFGNVRAVVVDEIHAFAGDDRGWHLLAVLERVARFAGRDLQRVGLSATVGEPERLLDWLAGSGAGRRRIIAPASDLPSKAEVTLDYVGSVENAATVISRLHRGEKRLVFCDSRSQSEEISAHLIKCGVETYVSHSSLGREERRRAEAAFASGHDCVIVATSTLELGIDIGDLDRVIQVDAPRRVASFLQRLGRTGRRPGTQRNMLFLTTSDEPFMRAAGLLRLWEQGYVEPIAPPAQPLHLFAQQIMALALQESGIGATSWRDWVGKVPAFAAIDTVTASEIVKYMAATEILHEDQALLWFGKTGEAEFGNRHFLELMSSFLTDPLFAVRWGRKHLGQVDAASFQMRHDEVPVLLLAGRSWAVKQIDWNDRIAHVEPVQEPGKSRWIGNGQPLHYALCQSIRQVLTGAPVGGRLSGRAGTFLDQLRMEFLWLDPTSTVILRRTANRTQWWTFGGSCANAPIAAALRSGGVATSNPTNFAIELDSASEPQKLEAALSQLRSSDIGSMNSPVEQKAIDDLKFSVCLPPPLAVGLLQKRLTDRTAITKVLSEPVKVVSPVD